MPPLPRLPRLPMRASLFCSAAAAIGVASCSIVHQAHRAVEDGIEHVADEAVACPPPKLPHHPSMDSLAHDLDCLEQQIDWYGSIVPKVPDIWSEARLARHREDFEKEMQKELSNFKDTINAAESRSDAAFSVQAASLSAAIKGGSITLKADPKDAPPVPKGDAKDNSDTAISLEPTIFLEQKARFINLLNQLRRNNEGDDTVDSPGYSMNLLRIPVSLLPGKRTQQGHGGEVSFTITPVLSDELLVTTFRQLSTMDLVDSFGVQLAQILDDPATRKDVETVWKEIQAERKKPQKQKDDEKRKQIEPPILPINPNGQPSEGNLKDSPRYMSQKAFLNVAERVADTRSIATQATKTRQQGGDATAIRNLNLLAGKAYAIEILIAGLLSTKDNVEKHRYVHLPDLQGMLKNRIEEAHRYLSADSRQNLWFSFCTRELAQALRSGNQSLVDSIRHEFEKSTQLPMSDPLLVAMAWCIIADSALLTEQLYDDIRTTTASKGKPIAVTPNFDLAYPQPSPESRQLFKDYVLVRWPIRVFALDPMNQDQNILDAATLKRETQLALSIGFVSGKVSASRFIAESRKLDLNAETVALNRTQVGFSHGENTFGWRFYPRYQVPGGNSTFNKVKEDLFGGLAEPDRLRQRRLEPGPRECVAIVLMPSFVPYLNCDSFSNWFNLANPKHKVFDNTQALNLGHRIKLMQTHGPGVGDSGQYRDGDHPRLLRRIEQLDSRMPSQTMSVQVPVRSTMSGSDLFTTGTAAMAPELYGFYGAPGIDLSKDEVTLFFVGDRFSASQTWIDVGNERPSAAKKEEKQYFQRNFRMLSRQVLQVHLATKNLVATKEGYVIAHVATPYGVTQGIKIPVFDSKKDAKPKVEEGFLLGTEKIRVYYKLNPVGQTEGYTIDYKSIRIAGNPRTVSLKPVDAIGSAPASIELRYDFADNRLVPNSTDAGFVSHNEVADGTYKMTDEAMRSFLEGALRVHFGDTPLPADDPKWSAELKTRAIEVTPFDRAGKVRGTTVPTLNQLTLVLQPEIATAGK
jgi:hypothetical protein